MGALSGRLAAAKCLREWGEKNTPVRERDLTAIENSCTRPQLVQLNRCRNVRLDGFATRGAPFWTIHVLLCIGCEVSGGVRNVRLENCTVKGAVDRVVFVKVENVDGIKLDVSAKKVYPDAQW
ncbi:MAG: hypothetical protein WC340_07160 [Kiritimatiellia bacterium]